MRIDKLGKLFLLYYVTAFLVLWYSEERMIWWVFLGICFVVYAALLLERVLPRKTTSGDTTKKECRNDNH